MSHWQQGRLERNEAGGVSIVVMQAGRKTQSCGTFCSSFHVVSFCFCYVRNLNESKLSFGAERLTRDCFGTFGPFYIVTSLEVPPSLNKMDVLNEYFGRFGPAPQFPSKIEVKICQNHNHTLVLCLKIVAIMSCNTTTQHTVVTELVQI